LDASFIVPKVIITDAALFPFCLVQMKEGKAEWVKVNDSIQRVILEVEAGGKDGVNNKEPHQSSSGSPWFIPLGCANHYAC